MMRRLTGLTYFYWSLGRSLRYDPLSFLLKSLKQVACYRLISCFYVKAIFPSIFFTAILTIQGFQNRSMHEEPHTEYDEYFHPIFIEFIP